MLYTCPKCNQPFSLDPTVVSETKSFTCPHCQAHFDFGTEEEVPAEAPAMANTSVEELNPKTSVVEEAEVEETKKCPFCGEKILASALKCKHCGEILAPNNPLYAALNIQPPTGEPFNSALVPNYEPAPSLNPFPSQFPCSRFRWRGRLIIRRT